MFVQVYTQAPKTEVIDADKNIDQREASTLKNIFLII